VTYTLKIAGELPNGAALAGLTAQVAGSGQPATPTSLPAAISLPSGSSYTITAGNMKGFSFTRWSSGVTSASVTILLDQNTSLVAFYKPLGTQTLAVTAKLLNGKSVVGVQLDIINHQLQQASAHSTDIVPANLTSKYGDFFTVTAGSAAAVAFQYWNGDHGMTNASLTVTLTGNITVTAYYQELALPYAHSGTGNHTITAIAHTMDGGLVVGAYFQVRINGAWDNVASGYTPGSVTVPNGNEELVMYHCAQTAGCESKFFVYRYYNNTKPTTFTRWQYIDLQSDMVVNSFYQVIPASEAVHVTIEAVNSTGPIFVNCTCGSLITIAALNGTTIAQSLEPYSFWLLSGESYTVTVGNLPGYTFQKWTTGSTSFTITFVAQATNPSDPYYQYFAAIYSKSG
jgi:Divergent InlB B-repeat domain